MPQEIDPNDPKLSIYDWSYANTPLSELKKWVDAQIAAGKTTVKVDISWGYYNDIDSLDLRTE